MLDGRAGVKIIEAQVGCGQQLGQHNNLSGVHREVFGDVEDGFQEVDVVALDRYGDRGRSRDRERGELFRLPLRVERSRFRSSSRVITSLCANSASRIRVSGCEPNTGNNPLTRVAAEVQDQIADTVRFLVRTPPDLFVRQLFETTLNLGQIVTQ